MEIQLIKNNLRKSSSFSSSLLLVSYQIIFTLYILFFATNCIRTQNIIFPLPEPYINGIKVSNDLSFAVKLGFNLEPTERSVDEAYGVDSIYYYRSDSLSLVYLLDENRIGLSGIGIDCSDCFGLSESTKIRFGDKIKDLIYIYPKLFAISNPSKDFTEISQDEIDEWVSISLKIDNLGGVISIYDFGLVNFSLKGGIITDYAIQYYME